MAMTNLDDNIFDVRQTLTEPIDVFRMYLAIKSHFHTDSYDYFKYRGGFRGASPEAFSKRKDRSFFIRLSKMYNTSQLEMFFVTNFVYNPRQWVGELLDKSATKIYKEMSGRVTALEYTFTRDIEWMLLQCEKENREFSSLLTVDSRHSSYPDIISFMLQGDVSVETVVVLSSIIQLLAIWDRDIPDKIRWPDVSRRLKKYRPFLTIDRGHYKRILQTKLRGE